MTYRRAKTVLMEIPEGIEKDYQLFLRRLMQAVTASTMPHEDSLRTDQVTEEDIPPAALAAFEALGISFEQLVDERELRKVLRRIGREVDAATKRALARALGQAIEVDVSGNIDRWVDAQVALIAALILKWGTDVGRAMGAKGRAKNPGTKGAAQAGVKAINKLEEQGSRRTRQAFVAASTAILLLNSELVEKNAKAINADSYIWRTLQDEVTREHHSALDGTPQKFSSPPDGGGTDSGSVGNPGSGLNCRCIAEVVLT